MIFAATELSAYPVSKVCRILDIPRSSYYDALHNGQRRRLHAEADRKAVYDMFFEHLCSFGRRVIKNELDKIGIHMSENKVSRIMKELGCQSKYHRKRGTNIHTNPQMQEIYIHENLLRGLPKKEAQKLKIWCMDFTEVKVSGKKVYICGIIDARRKILVGYSFGSRCTAALATKAVAAAIRDFGAPDIIHTDRGAQFTSKEFRDMLCRMAIRHSMSRPHTPSDNCYIETFWKSFKIELGKISHLSKDAFCLISEYYFHYYNTRRPHSSLHYQTPLIA